MRDRVIFCYQNGFYPENGGVQKYCYLLGEFLKKNGFVVYYLSLVNDIKFANLNSENYFYLPDKNNLFSKTNKKFYNKLLLDEKIDFVINNEATNDRFSFFIPSNSSIKHIAIFHSNPLINVDFSNKIKHTAIINWLIILKRKCKILKLTRSVDSLIFLSEIYQKKINNFWSLKSSKINFITNFLKADTTNMFTVKENIVLFVGRLDSIKQVDVLVKSWALIENKNVDWKLVVVGDGNDMNNLKALCLSLNLNNVTFTGRQNPDIYYKKSKILVLPSKYEGFGLVLIEAMSFGAVPLAFNNWLSLKDIIDHEINGLVIQDKTVSGLKNSLEILMNNNDFLLTLSKNAIEKSKNFHIDEVGHKWINLLDNLK